MSKHRSVIPLNRVAERIVTIRDQRVILDADLAFLYGVRTFRLNEQVKRNRERFPADFMFQLSADEAAALRSQIAISKGRGGRRYLPHAFTEHGAIMAASVLSSPQAVYVSLFVVRAFVAMRAALISHRDLAAKIAELESRYDRQFKVVFDALHEIMRPPTKPGRRIGFETEG